MKQIADFRLLNNFFGHDDCVFVSGGMMLALALAPSTININIPPPSAGQVLPIGNAAQIQTVHVSNGSPLNIFRKQ
jgi:hypothetical protein